MIVLIGVSVGLKRLMMGYTILKRLVSVQIIEHKELSESDNL